MAKDSKVQPQNLRSIKAQARATLKELKGKEYNRGYEAGLKAGAGLLHGGKGH